MKKFLFIFASAAFMLGMASCSGTCKTCTIGTSSITYCPADAPAGVSGDTYMSAAETACNASGGTWN